MRVHGQEVGDAGEQGCGGFGAADDEDFGVGDEFFDGEVLRGSGVLAVHTKL